LYTDFDFEGFLIWICLWQ